MKINLITTLPTLVENKRIEEEVIALGHSFELVNQSNFGFLIKEDKVQSQIQDCDLIILRGIFTSIKSISTLVSDLRNKGTKVFDNNLLKYQYSIDKVADILKLSTKAIPVPDTFYTRSFEDFTQAIRIIGFPMIIKSTRMGKGAGIVKLENETEVLNFVSELESDGREAKGYLIQKFIDYEHDLRALIIGEKVFAMKRIPKEGEFRANFSLGGAVEIFELSEQDKELAIKALKAVDLKIGGVDILIAKDGKRYILEVNHTAGMVGMEKATGENITKKYVEYTLANAL